MRGIVIIFSFIATTLASGVTFENIDIDKIIQNETQTQAVFACILDQGPCGEMQGLRDTVPHIIKTECGDCSPKMKLKYEHIKQALLEKYPDKLNAILLKYSSRK